jgi:DNA-binding NtrC family response regulator
VQATVADEDVPVRVGLGLRDQLSLLEARLIAAAMRQSGGNKSEAARLLLISYPSLLQKLKLRKDALEQVEQSAE